MCSILFTSKDIKDYDDINYYLKFRGPDDTSIVKDEVNNLESKRMALKERFNTLRKNVVEPSSQKNEENFENKRLKKK